MDIILHFLDVQKYLPLKLSHVHLWFMKSWQLEVFDDFPLPFTSTSGRQIMQHLETNNSYPIYLFPRPASAAEHWPALVSYS